MLRVGNTVTTETRDLGQLACCVHFPAQTGCAVCYSGDTASRPAWPAQAVRVLQRRLGRAVASAVAPSANGIATSAAALSLCQ